MARVIPDAVSVPLSLFDGENAKGMTTDVYPRENCIAPAIVLIVWTTNTKNGCAREG